MTQVTTYEHIVTDEGAVTLTDSELLDGATALGCALFTFDDDLLQEANARQATGVEFTDKSLLPSTG